MKFLKSMSVLLTVVLYDVVYFVLGSSEDLIAYAASDPKDWGCEYLACVKELDK